MYANKNNTRGKWIPKMKMGRMQKVNETYGNIVNEALARYHLNS